ncbi:MAG: hypothetical protein ABW185_14460 [Sedimenticola sp.]
MAESQNRYRKHCITLAFLQVPLLTAETVTMLSECKITRLLAQLCAHLCDAKTTAKTSFSLMCKSVTSGQSVRQFK